MKSEKTLARTSKALALMVVSICMLAGCGREQSPEEVKAPDPSSPASYMNDKVFMAQMKERDEGRRAIMKKFAQTRKAYDAACAKDPKGAEAVALKKQMGAIEDEFQKQRLETTRLVRERIAPKKAK